MEAIATAAQFQGHFYPHRNCPTDASGNTFVLAVGLAMNTSQGR